jgi:hypothetical protein
MSVNEPRSIHAAEDWGVVLQSVPSKHKKEIVKRLQEIFGLDKHDAEQVLSNMPLILVDNVSFSLAARIKKFFQSRGAVAETTNHDMIKKNCFQIVWPQTPDLSFFLMEDTKAVDAPASAKKPVARPAAAPVPEPKPIAPEIQPEPSDFRRSLPPIPTFEYPSQPAGEAKPAPVMPSSPPSSWAQRAEELSEKLRKLQEEKQQLHDQHAEKTEKVKMEFQQQLEKEKQKSEEISRAYEELQKQAQKQESLSQEGSEWRSKAMALGEKVRNLETDLMQKTSAIEHLIQQKDELARQAEKAGALSSRVSELERIAASKDQEKIMLEKQVADFDREHSDVQREITNLKSREEIALQKIEALEHHIQELTEALHARDNMLGQFEQQVQELDAKAQEYEALRQEHAQLVQERATIRKGYDAKLVEQEVRLAKVEEEHRRYRSRVDRKTAAATRELGEWVRGVDTVRQGLQKLILFLGNDSAVLETEKKSPLRSPLTRGPDAPNPEKD